jgi:ABC-type multidrug transport system fused ATPase/permease subunit
MNKENCSKLFFICVTIWGIVGIFLVFLQIYLMFQHLLFVLPLFFFVEYFFLKSVKKIYQKIKKSSRILLLISYTVVGIHFIPLFLQLIEASAPGFDNILVALIGMWIFYIIPSKK